jgi:hypothetical protein
LYKLILENYKKAEPPVDSLKIEIFVNKIKIKTGMSSLKNWNAGSNDSQMPIRRLMVKKEKEVLCIEILLIIYQVFNLSAFLP